MRKNQMSSQNIWSSATNFLVLFSLVAFTTCNVQTESVAENMAPRAAYILIDILRYKSFKIRSKLKNQYNSVGNHLCNLVAPRMLFLSF